MKEAVTPRINDSLLIPFLQSVDDFTSERLLGQLIEEHADPIISSILKTKLRVSLNLAQGDQVNQDALEIASDLRATLISDLLAVKENTAQKTITSFRDYVAVKTYSACADYFREKNPHRWRLKNLLRYQLKNNPRFALWKSDNQYWYVGFAEWQAADIVDDRRDFTSGDIWKKIFAQPDESLSPASFLTTLFSHVGHPIQFERVVSLAAEVWDVSNMPAVMVDAESSSEMQLVSPHPGADIALEQRLHLQKLWSEVCQLPVLQRAALLLNLRDANQGSAIFFLPQLGIATKEQIALVLELPEEEFLAEVDAFFNTFLIAFFAVFFADFLALFFADFFLVFLAAIISPLFVC